MHVPYCKSVHGEEEIAAVVSVLRTSTQMGYHVAEMERQVARLFDKKLGVMVNSCSSANQLAVEILNLPPGSEVITPALTFSTTVAPLVRNQLIPVFIDVEPATFNIDANQIESVITANTRAMMIPNLIGNLPDWEKIRKIADRYQLILIEDSADTIGAQIDGRSASRFSDISTTSFYGSHVINCGGNGGMLCMNNSEWAAKAKLLRSWGRSSSLFMESESIEDRLSNEIDGITYDAKFIFEALGYNFEPSEMGAAFGLVQLNKLEENIAARERNFNAHVKFFSQYPDWFTLPKQLPHSRTGWLAFPLIVHDTAPFSRQALQLYLEKRNIQTRTVLSGNILRHPGFRKINCRKNPQGYPEADKIMQGGILIGCHHGMTVEMMEHLQNSFKKFINQKNISNSLHSLVTS